MVEDKIYVDLSYEYQSNDAKVSSDLLSSYLSCCKEKYMKNG